MDITAFNRVLKFRYAPNYSFLRFPSDKLLENFLMKSFIVEREHNQVVKVTKEAQEKIFTNLCSKEIENHVIGISSSPNDFLAFQTATSILYSQIKNNSVDFEIINTGFPDKAKRERPKIVIFYNILPIRERIYQLRDLLDKYNNSLRLVVISGINALTYFDEYLHYPISGVMNIHSTKNPNCYSFISIKDNKSEIPIFDHSYNSLLGVLDD